MLEEHKGDKVVWAERQIKERQKCSYSKQKEEKNS